MKKKNKCNNCLLIFFGLLGIILIGFLIYYIYNRSETYEEVVFPLKRNEYNSNFEILYSSDKLKIYMIHNFFTEEENKYLHEQASRGLKRSTVVGKNHNNDLSKARTSETRFLNDINSEKIITDIRKKVSNITNLPGENLEIPQLVKYKGFQQYKPHYDYFEKGSSPLTHGGQRVFTLFGYLNTVGPGKGGETHFPKLNLKVRPKRNCAVFWNNLDLETGENLEETLHAGLPLNDDAEKLGVNLWIREREFK